MFAKFWCLNVADVPIRPIVFLFMCSSRDVFSFRGFVVSSLGILRFGGFVFDMVYFYFFRFRDFLGKILRFEEKSEFILPVIIRHLFPFSALSDVYFDEHNNSGSPISANVSIDVGCAVALSRIFLLVYVHHEELAATYRRRNIASARNQGSSRFGYSLKNASCDVERARTNQTPRTLAKPTVYTTYMLNHLEGVRPNHALFLGHPNFQTVGCQIVRTSSKTKDHNRLQIALDRQQHGHADCFIATDSV